MKITSLSNMLSLLSANRNVDYVSLGKKLDSFFSFSNFVHQMELHYKEIYKSPSEKIHTIK